MFSVYDLQLGQYFHTGRNSNTKKECEIDIVCFLMECEMSEKEIDETINNDEKRLEILDLYEVRIDEHEEHLGDD